MLHDLLYICYASDGRGITLYFIIIMFVLQSSDAPDIEFVYDDADDHLSEIAGEYHLIYYSVNHWLL